MSQFPPHISNVVPIHSFSFLQPIHTSLSSYARLFEKRVTNKHTTPLQLWSHSKPSFPSHLPQPSSDDSRRSNRATSLTCKRPCAHIWNGPPSLCIAAQKGSFGVEMKAVHCPWEYWVSDCKRLSYNKSRIHSSTNHVASQPSPIHAAFSPLTPGFKLHSQQKSKTQENWNNAHAIKWSVSKIMNKTCNSLPIQCTSKSRHSPFHFSLLQFIASSPNTHSPFISPSIHANSTLYFIWRRHERGNPAEWWFPWWSRHSLNTWKRMDRKQLQWRVSSVAFWSVTAHGFHNT